MAVDLSSCASIESTSPFHYKTEHLPRSTTPPPDQRTAVDEALDGCRALLLEPADAQAAIARKVLAQHGSFDEAARAAFLDGLLERFSVDPVAVQFAAEAYARTPADDTLQALRQASEEPRRELFLRLNAAPGATAWLVRLREYLLEHLDDHRAWAKIDGDLAHVLRLLFNRGLLDFQQIDLETPSAVLERLIQTEAVHPVSDWREMGRRLEADRRCYAFFHPAWPHEPLIFVEVALTRGMASTIQPILDPGSPVVDPRSCDTAMFYSISNCQPGLRGFSFGNALLGRVIERLRAEMPWLRQFATISPIPGFRSWLFSGGSLKGSVGIAKWLSNSRYRGGSTDLVPDELRSELLALGAHYLLRVKQVGEPADPVARFHLANGARLHRLNSSSDLTPAGIRHSVGLTVNYVYKWNELERNAETYRRRHEVRAVAEVTRLAGQAELLLANPS
jgi:malonyl-CoA decarboxylase